MNDRINGVDPHAVNMLHLTSVEQLFLLANAETAVSRELLDMADDVSDGKAGFSDAIMLWLVDLYNQGRINIRQLNCASYTYHIMHPELQVTLYETVFEVDYPHSVAGLV